MPEETVAQWDRVKMIEAILDVTMTNAQSPFFYLKYGEQIIEAARGDQRLADEVNRLKAALRTCEDERNRAAEALRKIRAYETKLTKKRDQLSQVVSTLDKENEEEAVVAAGKIHDLELKIANIQATSRNNKDMLLEAKKAKSEAGYQNGISDYMNSTIEMFLDLDWSRLGVDSKDGGEN